ncbi:hypothetical protein NDU88_001606 [Pleurodeles waltl]|uniref:Uncharacterized protein n=1 Tax=Pleurodeles waltl TaxID=8319 RepID=A0AAV7UT77_PLEWA|nr:hypothetical protein NDU88_001606 [Pleurodeles waltl]
MVRGAGPPYLCKPHPVGLLLQGSTGGCCRWEAGNVRRSLFREPATGGDVEGGPQPHTLSFGVSGVSPPLGSQGEQLNVWRRVGAGLVQVWWRGATQEQSGRWQEAGSASAPRHRSTSPQSGAGQDRAENRRQPGEVGVGSRALALGTKQERLVATPLLSGYPQLLASGRQYPAISGSLQQSAAARLPPLLRSSPPPGLRVRSTHPADSASRDSEEECQVSQAAADIMISPQPSESTCCLWRGWEHRQNGMNFRKLLKKAAINNDREEDQCWIA